MVEPQPKAPLPGNDERPNLVAVPAQGLSDRQMSFDAVEGEDEVLFRISTDALTGENDLVSDDAAEDEAAGEASDEVEAEGVAEAEVAEVAEVESEVAEAAEAEVGEPEAEVAAEVEPQPEPEAPSVAFIVDLAAHPLPYEPPQTAPVDDTSLQARLARIHLRTGSFALARAELEMLAGRNQLDTEGRLDLAEARWRTGDLHGAGEAASAYLAANGEEVLGFVIAAEAAATVNRLAEAGHYVERAMELYLSDLDPVFAGIARKAMWSAVVAAPVGASVPQAPAIVASVAVEPVVEPVVEVAVEPAPEPVVEPAVEPAPEPAAAVEQVAVEPAPEPAVEQVAPEAIAAVEPVLEPAVPVEPTVEQAPEPAVAVEPAPEPVVELAPEPAAEPTPEPAAAVEPAPEPAAEAPEDPTAAQADGEVASGRSYLEGNDPLLAALHFGVAMRLNRTRVDAVIEAIGDRQEVPLQMVRAEAVRLRAEAVRLREEATRLREEAVRLRAEGMRLREEAVRPHGRGARLRGRGARLRGMAAGAGTASQSAVIEPSAPIVEPAVEPAVERAVEPEPPAPPKAPELPPIRWD
jgi:hypothetical protein